MDGAEGKEIKVRFEHQERVSDVGLRPFTDIFVELDGRHIYSRHMDYWTRAEVISWAEQRYDAKVRKMQGRDLPGHGGH